MFHNLDVTLRKLFQGAVDDFDENKRNVYFEAPDDKFQPSLPAINLFLYDIRENSDLRSNEWLEERQNGTFQKKPAPIRVECSYLITAWAGDIESEHKLLGEIMRVLLRHPKIPSELLNSVLKEKNYPLPTLALQSGRLQSLGEFWQALGGKPKASLHFTVTIPVDPFDEPKKDGKLVVEKVIGMKQIVK